MLCHFHHILQDGIAFMPESREGSEAQIPNVCASGGEPVGCHATPSPMDALFGEIDR